MGAGDGYGAGRRESGSWVRSRMEEMVSGTKRTAVGQSKRESVEERPGRGSRVEAGKGLGTVCLHVCRRREQGIERDGCGQTRMPHEGCRGEGQGHRCLEPQRRLSATGRG